MEKLKTYQELSINEKIYIKQHAMNLWGKRIHYSKPNFLNKLNVLQIISIL